MGAGRSFLLLFLRDRERKSLREEKISKGCGISVKDKTKFKNAGCHGRVFPSDIRHFDSIGIIRFNGKNGLGKVKIQPSDKGSGHRGRYFSSKTLIAATRA